MAIKILLGGSPCTHWSIAQKNNRETEPSGMGWELFKNYLIAKEKFKPDLFLYENNKSAAQPIKDQIAKELGVGVDPEVRFAYINSALVSAQNRQRFYVTNFGDIEQPEDRGIFLKDILDYGLDLSQRDESYCLTATYNGATATDTLERKQRPMVAEPVCMCYKRNDEAKKLRKQYEAGEVKHGFNEHRELHPRTDGKSNTLSTVLKDNPICEPVRIGCYPSPDGTLKNSRGMRLYSIEGKSVNLTANGGGMGAKTGLYAIPVVFEGGIPIKAISCADGKEYPVYQVLNGQITIKNKQYPIKLQDGYYIIRKLTVTECCRLQTMPDDYFTKRLFRTKEVVLCHKNAKSKVVKIPLQVEHRGCAISIILDWKEAEVQNSNEPSLINRNRARSKDVIEISKQQWDIVLCIIKELDELERQGLLETMKSILQAMMSTDLNTEKLLKRNWAENLETGKLSTILTLTQQIMTHLISMSALTKNTLVSIDFYEETFSDIPPTSLMLGISYSTAKDTKLVSDTACYKGLGNGWTAEVIIHLLNHALKNVPKDEELVVLSLYDGIGTGRYCLDKMGFTNIKYHAYEIDKYPMTIANDNYPDIVQHGDAFAVREDLQIN